MKNSQNYTFLALFLFFILFQPSCSKISNDKSDHNINGEEINVNPDKEPEFSDPIQNVTVPLGREAVLRCSVTELGAYKVGWMKAEDQTILTLHTRVVTHNTRVSVTHDNEKIWQLHIRQIRESDKGCYMCQINTNIMKKQLGCIDVYVPPDISDQTVSDVTVKEGGNATLECKAVGHPQPKITWRREDGQHIVTKILPKSNSIETFNGDSLPFVKTDRSQMGPYLCIASNDVPPAVSKRITLHVNFAPSVKVVNQLLGAPLRNSIVLECNVEGYPNTINYWVKATDNKVLQGVNYKIEEKKRLYKVYMKLTIKELSENDLGSYICVATNSFGRADGTIRIYEIKLPPTTTTTTTTTTAPTTTSVRTTTQRSVATTDINRKSYIFLTTVNSYIGKLQKNQHEKNSISLTEESKIQPRQKEKRTHNKNEGNPVIIISYKLSLLFVLLMTHCF